MKRAISVRTVDRRGWLLPRFKVGDHVRIPAVGLCGSVANVLAFPRVTAYGIIYDDHTQVVGNLSGGVHSERELLPA